MVCNAKPVVPEVEDIVFASKSKPLEVKKIVAVLNNDKDNRKIPRNYEMFR